MADNMLPYPSLPKLLGPLVGKTTFGTKKYAHGVAADLFGEILKSYVSFKASHNLLEIFFTMSRVSVN